MIPSLPLVDSVERARSNFSKRRPRPWLLCLSFGWLIACKTILGLSAAETAPEARFVHLSQFVLPKGNMYPLLARLDGDKKTDRVLFDSNSSDWYYATSSGSLPSWPNGQSWGSGSMVPLLGDIDGDGKADRVLWSPSAAAWFYLTSSGASPWPNGQTWGYAGTVPFLADVDGDGKGDRILWDPSNAAWYCLTSSGNTPWANGQSFGSGGMVPLFADVDGDGRADRVLFDPILAQWYFITSSGSTPWPSGQNWGGAGMIPFLVDINGDGKVDRVLFDSTTANWYFVLSGTGAPFPGGVVWGAWGNGNWIPFAADIDGDGKGDRIMIDPTNFNWYAATSSGINPAGWSSVPGQAWGPGVVGATKICPGVWADNQGVNDASSALNRCIKATDSTQQRTIPPGTFFIASPLANPNSASIKEVAVTYKGPGAPALSLCNDSADSYFNPGGIDYFGGVAYGPPRAVGANSLQLRGEWFVPHSLNANPAASVRGVLVLIHGGAWECGRGYRTSPIRQYAANMAARGWPVFSVEYRRVSEGGHFPEYLRDVNEALNYVNRVAPTAMHNVYPSINFNAIAVVGESAGGNIALMSGLMEKHAEWFAPTDPTRVHLASVVGISSVVDLTNWYSGNAYQSPLFDLRSPNPVVNALCPVSVSGTPGSANLCVDASPYSHAAEFDNRFYVIFNTTDNTVRETASPGQSTALATSNKNVHFFSIVGNSSSIASFCNTAHALGVCTVNNMLNGSGQPVTGSPSYGEAQSDWWLRETGIGMP